MRATEFSLLLITAYCIIAHAFAHERGEADKTIQIASPSRADPETVQASGTPAVTIPAIAYIPTKNASHSTQAESPSDLNMDMGIGMGATGDNGDHHPALSDGPIPPEEMSYWLWPEHRGLLYAHIAIMVLAWGFVLPVGVILGVAQSSFHIPLQFAFLVLTTVGVIFAIMYNSATPDFYENNAHHKIGWVIVWMLVAQAASGLIRGVARYVNRNTSRDEIAEGAEEMFILGSADEDDEDYDDDAEDIKSRRNEAGNSSGDHTPPRPGSASNNPPAVPFIRRRSSEHTLLSDRERNFHTRNTSLRQRNAESKIENYIAHKLHSRGWLSRVSRKGAFVAKLIHALVGRPFWCLGFIQVCTGIVTVTGIFKSWDVFNGLAHFIKGGIFLNYGIITLGRYLGAFADLGWAWNVKPPGELTGQKWKNRAPSAELIESSVICFYGASQSFMEHLGNHNGGLWSAKDLEHVSIAVMFFWAGLCGILIEVPSMRRCFNQAIERALPSQTGNYRILRNAEESQSVNHVDSRFSPPPQQSFSYNPFPGLIIFMTGIMMSMHHQESMLSTMIHKQWGYLLAAFALFRLATYFLMFINPPKSCIPSRPVTELLTSFCLICGGMIFMVISPTYDTDSQASNSSTVQALEERGVDAMFVFNLAVSTSSLIMAWIIIVMAIKGWAVHRRRA